MTDRTQWSLNTAEPVIFPPIVRSANCFVLESIFQRESDVTATPPCHEQARRALRRENTMALPGP